MSKLKTNLTHVAGQMSHAAALALAETAADIVELTKQITPVDTERLRGSYNATPLAVNRIVIGTDVEYAPYVEYGTSRSPAQPHFTPAFAQAEATFKKRLEQKLRGMR